MAYLFKQKLNLSELVVNSLSPKRVLIHEPEEYLAALYGHYLRQHNFDVKHCPDLEKISKVINIFKPDVLVFCADAPHLAGGLWNLLPRLSQDFPQLRLVSTGLDSSSRVKELMAAGVLGHINRKLSRPQDLAVIIKSIL